MNSTIPLHVKKVADVAFGVRLFEFQHVNSAPLPEFSAGSHIELQLPNHLSRSYSLLNAPVERHRYVVAVHFVPGGGGGSRFMHESLREGDAILASPPRNNFPLQEDAPHSCLIAGGIGITPMLSMVHRLNELNKSWELHYCARTRAHVAFADEIQSMARASGNSVHFYLNEQSGGESLNLSSLLGRVDTDSHVYCCGPKGMLSQFEESTATFGVRAHVEHFSAKSQAALEGGFVVELARSKLTLQVPPGKSILDVVLANGVSVGSSCREGVCGSCETSILAGEADHRDAILSDDERARNRTMMICCSGARSSRLVLDL